MNLEVDNTPMNDVPFQQCDFYEFHGTHEYFCNKLSKKRQGLWMYPCSKIQQIICPRAIKEDSHV